MVDKGDEISFGIILKKFCVVYCVENSIKKKFNIGSFMKSGLIAKIDTFKY